ncbi:MAG: hypothetical protein Q4G16_11715, partial [Cruoricaptor ignavus]|nr:hypothetical protein [Cruoricaptor ignavus]
MRKNISLIISLFGIFSANAQNISSSKWSDLFSYNNVLTIKEDNGKLIAATENGIFYYTPNTGEITKLSKANGLHEVKISAFDYNPETKIGLVGYTNGMMDVITEQGITLVVDIPLANGFTGSKNINHISITGNQAVISVDYGVSIFNLERKEFGETAFFLNTSGVYDAAKGAVIKDNAVYAITTNGVKKHEMNVTFPIYSGWSTTANGTFNHIDIENNVIAIAGNTQVLYGNGDSFTPISQGFSSVQDVSLSSQNILITDGNNVYAYTHSGQNAGSLTAGNPLNTAWYSNGQIYAGSSTEGILDQSLISYKPDGPYNNRAYKLSLNNDKIWVSTGARTGRYSGPPSATAVPSLGFYHFDGSQWIYPSYFLTNTGRFNIMDVTQNPTNDTDIFFSNLTNAANQGFYRMSYNSSSKDFELTKFYSTGSPFYLNRPVGLTYDDKNNLFATTSVYSSDWVTTYAVFNSSADRFDYKIIPGTNADSGTQKPIYHEGLLLMPIPRKNIFSIANLNNTPANLNDDSIYS